MSLPDELRFDLAGALDRMKIQSNLSPRDHSVVRLARLRIEELEAEVESLKLDVALSSLMVPAHRLRAERALADQLAADMTRDTPALAAWREARSS